MVFTKAEVAQQAVGAEVRLVERDAGGVGGGLQLLQGGGNGGARVAAFSQVGLQQPAFDRAVACPLAPLAEVAVDEVAELGRLREAFTMRFWV
jgi:hypothetical protein